MILNIALVSMAYHKLTIDTNASGLQGMFFESKRGVVGVSSSPSYSGTQLRLFLVLYIYPLANRYIEALHSTGAGSVERAKLRLHRETLEPAVRHWKHSLSIARQVLPLLMRNDIYAAPSAVAAESGTRLFVSP
jgi:hypothetical protein